MTALYTALVWLVVAAHFAFLIYLPSGGFLALRWRRSIWLHVPVVLWGIGSVALHFWCPLTALEQWSRPRAGMPPLGSAGFIDHYITGVMYPSGGTGYAQVAAFLAVLVSWTAYAVTARRSGHARPAVGAPADPVDLNPGAHGQPRGADARPAR
ncbi:DUF2784 domain-containing protein [Mycolicibacterium sp. CBM1]